MSMNTFIKGKGFFISWAPEVGETALVKQIKPTKKQPYKTENYYILMGNYLTEYKPIVKKGYKACKKFYDNAVKNDAKKSFWSD